MELFEEDKSRQDFKEILMTLAKDATYFESPIVRKEIFIELEALYYDSDEEKRFRHFYSDIFETLTEINSAEGGKLGSIQALTENLSSLRREYTPERKDKDGNLIDISKELRKLDDHISLDCARIDYSDKGDFELKKEPVINDIETQIKKLNEQIQNSEKELEKTSIKNLKDNITILGIFSAVVISFVSGIGFTTSVLSNMTSVSIYRLVFVSCIIGIVLVCVLYGMFYYVDRIVKASDNPGEKVFWNAIKVLAFIIAMVLLAWLLKVIEWRNSIGYFWDWLIHLFH